MALAALAAAAIGAGCQGPRTGPASTPGPATAADQVTVPAFLDQGWSPAEREAFWFTSQGSRILSYDIFEALEQADSEEPFRSPANIRRFGYIPWPVTPRNPDGLPIGFVRDEGPGGKAWMGLTCAACHTGVVSHQGRETLIDGAPTLADFAGFVEALVDAMRANQDGAKLDRLAGRITAEPRERLLERLKRETAALERRQARNRSDTEYGHARLDAFGQIFNEVTAHALGIPTNAHPANAPVSYPFLWGAPQSDRVQWPGLAENTPPVGALTRNVGEVLGVFAHLEVSPVRRLTGYPSSARLRELAMLENQLERLWRPSWNEAGMPPLDPALVATGGRIYAERCAGCHSVLQDPTDPARSIKVRMTRVDEDGLGTDPVMVDNALRAGQRTGRIEGRRERIIIGPRLGREALSVQILTNAVAGTLVTDARGTIEAVIIDRCNVTPVEMAEADSDVAPSAGDSAGAGSLEENVRRASDRARPAAERARSCRQALRAGARMTLAQIRERIAERLASEAGGAMQGGRMGLERAYKARPLDGIWATAPYLHNGSVPTLDDLLQPHERRPARFKVGSRELDPVKVGFRSDLADAGGFVLDTRIEGNSNRGHEGHAYGTDLSPEQRKALVEYLKSL